MIDKKERAERFRKARGNETHISIHKETGISSSMISDLENTIIDRPVQYQKVLTLAEHYGVNVAWLMGQSDSPSLNEDRQMISKFTGLSDNAIDALGYIKNNDLSEMLNRLIETDAFIQMLKWIKTGRIINLHCTDSDKTTLIDDEAYQGMISDTNGEAIASAYFPGESHIDMCRLRASKSLDKAIETIMKEDKENGKR